MTVGTPERLCVQNATHGRAIKSGRCVTCWEAKLASGNRRYLGVRLAGLMSGEKIRWLRGSY
jgi:hypothetical protein